MSPFAPNNKTTRSILVIEEEYDLRVLLLESLSAENWKVIFALTEEMIESALKEVAGVVLNWEVPELLNRDWILKKIGEIPLLVTTSGDTCPYPGFVKKPYSSVELARATQKEFSKDQFFVGDRVISKITPDWGTGKVVRILSDEYYGVVFKSDDHVNSPEIALKCHFTGLKWVSANG